jgi:heme exporter protein B
MNSLLKTLLTLIRFDLILALRHKSDWVNAWLFFILVVSLFPLAVTPDMSLLHMIGPGLIWVAALLSMLLSLHHFLRPDYEDGSLSDLLLSPHPLSLLILAKVIAHWIVSAVPLILLTPILGVSLSLSTEEILTLMLTLLLGTPVLNLVGSVAMALTVSLRHQSVLLSLLVLPLCVPVLIFGAGAVMNIGLGVSNNGVLALMGAILILALTLVPLAAASALRMSE